MSCLYEDNSWFAVEKPHGISTHAAYAYDLGLVEWFEHHLGKKYFVCSRLDKETSGVILFAKTKEASAQAQHIHEEEIATKTYALVSKNKHSESWTVSSLLDGAPASTIFSFEQQVPLGFLYRATIHRGRKHQIRRHAAESGITILGDREYGQDRAPRLFLHCSEIRWPNLPLITTKIPESFFATTEDAQWYAALERRIDLLSMVTQGQRLIQRGEHAWDLSIDEFGDFLNAWVYDINISQHELTKKLRFLMELRNKKGATIRYPQKNPHEYGLVKHIDTLGDPPPSFQNIKEGSCVFQVSLLENQHVGLFLEQRDNRKFIFNRAQGKRVANLFAYSCSFSVAAALAEADVVFSVDISKPALSLGKTNFELNSLTETKRGKFIQSDVRLWLKKQINKKEQFDLIVCDPPTFSSTKEGGTFAVEKEWDFLSQSCAQILAPGGHCLMVNNHRTGRHEVYEQTLRKYFKHVQKSPTPLDFPVVDLKEQYVRMFWCSQEKLL